MIIFCYKFKLKLFNPRTWLSNAIAYFQGSITHTAVIYERGETKYVREMVWYGVKLTPFDVWKEKQTREYIIKTPKFLGNIQEYNKYCDTTFVKYDYRNLLVFQVIKSITGYFFGSDTPMQRICSEDSARCFNIYQEKFFNPESINPKEMYYICHNWKTKK